jgi:hypothetical protein
VSRRERIALVRLDTAEEVAESIASAVGGRVAALSLLERAVAYLRGGR